MIKSNAPLLLSGSFLIFALLNIYPVQADHEGTLTLYLNGGNYWFDNGRLKGTPFRGGKLGDRSGGGIGFGYNITDHWALEGVYDKFNARVSQFNQNLDVHNYHLDLLYQFSGRFCGNFCWQPYVTLGAGEIRIDYRLASKHNSEQHRRQTMLNTGLGIKYRLGPRWQARADVRAFQGLEQGGLDTFVSLAIGYQWGADPIARDRDADGVYDNLDQCPQTPPGVAVYQSGCPLDSDGDGVPDYLDNCPYTLLGVAVTEQGCRRWQ